MTKRRSVSNSAGTTLVHAATDPSPAAKRCAAEVRVAITHGDLRAANAAWTLLSLAAPQHPQTAALKGELLLADGKAERANEVLLDALARGADTVPTRILLSRVQSALGDRESALQQLRLAEPDTSPEHALALGIEWDRLGCHTEARAAASRALAHPPSRVQALMLRARCQQFDGDVMAAAADYRAVLQQNPGHAAAWFALVDLKTIPLSPAECASMERQLEATSMDPDTRLLLLFAHARALESAGQWPRAFEQLAAANRLAHSRQRWDSKCARAQMIAIEDAFRGLPEPPASQPVEVIFICGLPRSGTTLVEQIIAAHPDVSGAGELSTLQQVVARESDRRQAAFPQWVAAATEADWQRLGEDYLRQVSHWRDGRQVVTDKMPVNWLYAGAAMRMLPQCRVLFCQRDPLETCWSCYQQRFAPGLADFAYDFDDLARYWADSERLARCWKAHAPQQFFALDFAALVAAPDIEIPALLKRCDLSLHADCLRPHVHARSIRTPSAAQVRQPIRPPAPRTPLYGPLLDDLRAAIARERRALEAAPDG